MEDTRLQIPEFKILVVLRLSKEKEISPFIAKHHEDGNYATAWEKTVWDRQDVIEPDECRLLLNWARSCEGYLYRFFCKKDGNVTVVNFRFSFDKFSNLEKFFKGLEVNVPPISISV